ncbi:hypothetical protein MHF_1317 [Mycoplasma haemofelis Ohio2]|uniref:Uncharacterized protein n=1 Tax=Mycoplasma haemofelis (strain Ohio2) TaxID=859194 RepID=F6FG55_MYCHI|nr:hypothetical protein MHF_1317 [Mycoplasma haemofelis Ohio2]
MKLGLAAASIGGASAVSVAAAGGYHFFSSRNESIQEALKNVRLISSLTGDALIKQWQEEFESDKKDIKPLIGFTSDDKEGGGRALAKWCNDQMSLDSVKHPEGLKNVKSYCLIRTVSSHLSRHNKTLLNESNVTEWQATYNQRKTKKTPKADIGMENDDWSADNYTKELPTVKTWCSTNSVKDFLASEDLYTRVLKWCTKEGATEA